ncbi:MAG TPA: hypothetical protein VK136_06330 [Bacillota bacterium]|nr:hypothetical protein [Bacillota bacterium]
MKEQERYKRILQKVIDKTENDNIQSAEELIQTLIDELSRGINLPEPVNRSGRNTL